jgi:hypothetical protein
MFRMTSHLAAPAVVLLMGSTASFALTADEVWQSWKDAGAAAGLEVTAATENNAGGVLTLNGVSIAPAGGAGITISDMTLTEASDGSVSIVPGADIGVAMAGETTGSVKVTHDGLTMVAREADGGVAYDYTAAKLDVVYDTAYPGVSFDGSLAPEVKAAGTFGFANLAGVYSDTPGDNRTFGLDLTADTLAYTTSTDDPMMELKQTTSSETQGIELSFDLTLPTSMSAGGMTAAPADFGAALQEGLAISFTSKQGESTGTMNQESPYMPMALTIKAGGGEAAGEFNKDVLSLTSTGSGLQIDGTSGMLPVPVTVTSGPVEFGFNMPVTAVDVAGDFGFLMKLSQFSLNEEAWGLFDPQGALKHDAADLAIDISGKTKMDIPAMIAASETGGMPPTPAPESLDITEMSLKVAGAALDATGAFTFDNSMGMPMPLGEANVTVTGATQLIDGLIATGLITEDDAMGARMMMGMFMTPAGEDTLTSKIETKEGFAIFVNGQQIQ